MERSSQTQGSKPKRSLPLLAKYTSEPRVKTNTARAALFGTYPIPMISRYIHILFRSNSLFLLLGSMIVPAAITLDARAFVFALWVLFFGGHWGMMAGTTFGLALIFSIKRFAFLSSITKRRHWLLTGMILGLAVGILIAAIASIEMLREAALRHRNHNETFQMSLRMFIVPSAICGCICGGVVLYPNDLNIQNSNPDNIWVWTDILWALPIVFLATIKIMALNHV